VDAGGLEEGVGRVDVEGLGEEVLALGDLALVDLLVDILVCWSAMRFEQSLYRNTHIWNGERVVKQGNPSP
jgi:hypothetical protein